MTTARDNADVTNHLFPNDALDTAIEWITANPFGSPGGTWFT
jgi:hypothetical protein